MLVSLSTFNAHDYWASSSHKQELSFENPNATFGHKSLSATRTYGTRTNHITGNRGFPSTAS